MDDSERIKRARAMGVGRSTAEGYGWRHQQRRAVVARQVAAGGVCCARCGEPIEPGTPWDLGHVDGDRTRYQGAEHRACNRSTAGRRRLTSRVW